MAYRRKIPLSEHVLICLRNGLETSNEIADETWASQASVSNTLARLIETGLVERESRPAYYLNGNAPQPAYRYWLASRGSNRQRA